MEVADNPFQRFITLSIRALNKSEIDYVLIGGVIVSIYGRPRSTMNIDVIIEKNLDKIVKLENILRKETSIVGENEIKDAILSGSHCSVFDNETILRLDIKTPTRKLEEEALQNKTNVTIFGEETFIQIPEEVIIAKLLYASDQDIDDAYSIILRLKKELNYELLRRLAERESVIEELENLLKQSEKIDV
jgi:hypothetical protein